MTRLPFEDVAVKSYWTHDARLLGYRPGEKPRRNLLQSPSSLNWSELPFYTADVRDSGFSALRTPGSGRETSRATQPIRSLR
jgi:hypothetical protein